MEKIIWEKKSTYECTHLTQFFIWSCCLLYHNKATDIFKFMHQIYFIFFKVFFTFFFPNIKNRKDLLHLLKGLHVVRYPRGFKHKVDASLPCFKLMYLCAHSQIYNYFVKCKVWTEYTRWTNRNLQYSPTFTRNNHIISSD